MKKWGQLQDLKQASDLVKPTVLRSHITKDLGRSKPAAMLLLKILQHGKDLLRAEPIDMTERPSPERRKSEAENRTDVPVLGRIQDP